MRRVASMVIAMGAGFSIAGFAAPATGAQSGAACDVEAVGAVAFRVVLDPTRRELALPEGIALDGVPEAVAPSVMEAREGMRDTYVLSGSLASSFPGRTSGWRVTDGSLTLSRDTATGTISLVAVASPPAGEPGAGTGELRLEGDVVVVDPSPPAAIDARATLSVRLTCDPEGSVASEATVEDTDLAATGRGLAPALWGVLLLGAGAAAFVFAFDPRHAFAPRRGRGPRCADDIVPMRRR